VYGPAMQAVGTGRLVAGRYRLNGQIGLGAMGIVWRGRDDLLDRDVAVKEVRIAVPGTADDGTAYQRTLREAKTAARLSHPGVVTVFDVVEENGTPWIVMELVHARSLDQVVAEDGPLRPAEAADVGGLLLSALTCAHAAGVLHRDVKPSNVLITPEGSAVLTDFGIATFEGDPSITQVGMVVGTPGFTAPERVRGEPATPASDLWSLGATLFAAVEGRGPFDRPGGSAVVTAGVVSEDAPRAPSAGPLGPVIEALLRTDPGLRPDAVTAARMLSAAAERGRPEQGQPGGRRAARGGAGRAGAAMAGAPGLAADATTAARRIPGEPSAPGAIGDLPGSPAFADVHEFPEPLPPAELPESMELPAFMDTPPFGDSPALPPGQSVPWSVAGPADALNLADPLNMQGSGQRSAAAAAGGGPRQPAGAAAPPPARRYRVLAVVAGAVVAAVAGFIGWNLFPHSVNAAAGRPSLSAQPSAGGQASPGLRAPASGPAAKQASAPGGAAGSAAGSPGNAAGGTTATSTHQGTGSTGTQGATGTGAGGSGSQAGGGTTPAPPGYGWLSVPAVTAGTAAGFRIAIPDTWSVTTQGLVTYVDSPAGNTYIEVNLAPFSYPRPLREAQFLQAEAIQQNEYPGYQVVAISPAAFRNVPAATWRFNWRQHSLGHVAVLELLFSLKTAAGPQDYALSVSAPALAFPAARGVFDEALHTFRRL
jgi:serine/threonine protein kinase